jgi:dipeptidyl aminopeptidase/acylaminoacyl peptidase
VLRTSRFFPEADEPEHRGIYVGSVDGETQKFLLRAESSSQYVWPGYLLYLDGDTLLGQAFDTARLEIRGEPFTVAEHVGRSTGFNVGASASGTGMLAYAAAVLQQGRLTWFDRSGNSLSWVGVDGDYPDFRLSPNGQMLAVSLVDPKGWNPDIWLIDLTRGASSRFTFGSALNAAPVWSPDGARIVFRTNRNGMTEFYEKSAGAGGNETPRSPVRCNSQPASTRPISSVPTGPRMDAMSLAAFLSSRLVTTFG